jgi:hypothetical protein
MAFLLFAVPVLSFAQLSFSVSIAPPILPVYSQPLIPGPGYIWTPGYWAFGPNGYFWVPGTWVLPPSVGLLWTPGYWGWNNGFYLWNGGYWGPHVGFYGGVNYGYGYTGSGYYGGRWNNGSFYYNRAVNNVNVNIVHNTYNTVIHNTTVNRVSFNGGNGGIHAEATPYERQAMGERRFEATGVQMQHQQAAASNRTMLYSENHGRPAIAATPQAGHFDHPGVVPAYGGPQHNKSYAQGNPQAGHTNPQLAHPNGQGSANAQYGHPNVQGGYPNGQGGHPQTAKMQNNMPHSGSPQPPHQEMHQEAHVQNQGHPQQPHNEEHHEEGHH